MFQVHIGDISTCVFQYVLSTCFISVSEGSTDTSRCPKDLDRTAYLRSYGNKCYYFERSETTWPNAQARCKRLGGDLITITQREIQVFVEGVLRELWTNNGMWIGAHDRHDEMDWYWVNGKGVSILSCNLTLCMLGNLLSAKMLSAVFLILAFSIIFFQRILSE
ncbi:hypothetical protein DPMN_123758 [Dreissena polymorpha]|uniref:C-type lectin domain-containing protein n=1 Tax=Dreissena polymorpha TaxID=45954 RepID=A0A9D4JT67_DREPO|nr:hypothetical protein DPMN_123758 [Dreissena polymorpha]